MTGKGVVFSGEGRRILVIHPDLGPLFLGAIEESWRWSGRWVLVDQYLGFREALLWIFGFRVVPREPQMAVRYDSCTDRYEMAFASLVFGRAGESLGQSWSVWDKLKVVLFR